MSDNNASKREQDTTNRKNGIHATRIADTLKYTVCIGLVAAMLCQLTAHNDEKAYRDIEQKLNGRKGNLSMEMTRADSLYQIRHTEILNTYRMAINALMGTRFKSAAERDTAIDALHIAYATYHTNLKNAHEREMDSLVTLYNQTQRQIDSAHRHTYGREK